MLQLLAFATTAAVLDDGGGMHKYQFSVDLPPLVENKHSHSNFAPEQLYWHVKENLLYHLFSQETLRKYSIVFI